MISIASETLKSKENSLPVLRLKKCGEDGWRVVSQKQSAKPKYMSNKLSILPLKHSSRALPDDNVNNSLNNSFHPSVKKPTSKVKQSKGVSTGLVSSSFRVKEMSVDNNVDMPPKDVQSVLLLSDSHGRRLCGKVKLLVKPAVKTESVVLPGKKFECVMEGSNLSGRKLTKQDYVVILAGTNNVPDHCDGLCVSLGRALEGLADTNVIVLGIPKRFDAPNLNDVINGVNRDLLATVGRHAHADFVSLECIPRRFFTRHGLHFNELGKRRVAELIVNALPRCFGKIRPLSPGLGSRGSPQNGVKHRPLHNKMEQCSKAERIFSTRIVYNSNFESKTWTNSEANYNFLERDRLRSKRK
ncbi:hypothetical protein J6590_095102 [Homalodisca vitripennis]|nr:hypothetical protein J6590_095102 [Homalodisca vitripennis]